ncbi:MAG: DNA repair protein RecN [Gammaproteobacteria bacterium]
MLIELNIKHFALIENLHLNFQTGMTVITGETGAGKSILIDAIELALGARLDGTIVQPGADRCDLSISFDIRDNHVAQSWLKTHEINLVDDLCVLRRVINTDNRSRCYINDQPMTLQKLIELGTFLITIHGQNAHQLLLKSENQRHILDEYAGQVELVKNVSQLYSQWKEVSERIKALMNLDHERVQRKEFILFQLSELQTLALKENEVELLTQNHKQLAQADSILANSQQTLNCLVEGENHTALSLLQNALKFLHANKVSHPQLDNCQKILENAIILLQEAIAELNMVLSKIENNPMQLQEIEMRIAAIHELARKHRVSPEMLLELQKKLEIELSQIDNSDETLKGLQAQLGDLEKQYFKAAKKLTAIRQENSSILTKLVTENMKQLGMEGGKFEVVLLPEEDKIPHFSGLETVTFFVSANPGMPMQPLSKVASGGELSRISLALETIIASKVETPALIFDEVDVGIGGKTAEMVGRMLRTLAKTAQVICITHQPQVAAIGQHHLRVHKEQMKSKTTTQITLLSKDEKIQELARMLGGIKLTPQTLAHAEEMLAEHG